jgi:hypothetical protein
MKNRQILIDEECDIGYFFITPIRANEGVLIADR